MSIVRSPLMSTLQAAEYLGFSRVHVWRLIRNGTLPSWHVCGRHLLQKHVLDRFMEERSRKRQGQV